MELQSVNGLISFGKEFFALKDELQPSNQVMTSQVLAKTFPFKLSINLDKKLNLEKKLLNLNFKLWRHLKTLIEMKEFSMFPKIDFYKKL